MNVRRFIHSRFETFEWLFTLVVFAWHSHIHMTIRSVWLDLATRPSIIGVIIRNDDVKWTGMVAEPKEARPSCVYDYLLFRPVVLWCYQLVPYLENLIRMQRNVDASKAQLALWLIIKLWQVRVFLMGTWFGLREVIWYEITLICIGMVGNSKWVIVSYHISYLVCECRN